MDLTLVPFGLNTAEQRLVDVRQVPSGRRCGCTCPSCGAPLTARKGTRKVWHFAHDSRADFVGDLDDCQHSFFVSARMMAHQLIGSSLTLKLPPLRHTATETTASDQCISASELVTKASTVTLQQTQTATHLHEIPIDVLGRIADYRMAVMFTHPGRDIPVELQQLTPDRCGVVAISLLRLKQLFTQLIGQDVSYADLLAQFIEEDLESKTWIYHPGMDRAVEKVEARLRASRHKPMWRQSSSGRHRPSTSLHDQTLFENLGDASLQSTSDAFQFECRLCQSRWQGHLPGDSSCTKCRSSLLVSRKRLRICEE